MKKQCSNHPKYVYSGKESSPLGLGLAAEPLVLGTIMEGRDKTNWIVTLKNSIKVWSRVTRLSEPAKDDTVPVPTVPMQDPVAKAAPRKKQAAAAPSKKDDKGSAEGAPVAKRKPTNYNIYMKYKLKQLASEEKSMKPKERVAHAVAVWKSMTPEEMKDVMEKAKAAALEEESL